MRELRHRLAAAGDDDLLAMLRPVEKLGEPVLRLKEPTSAMGFWVWFFCFMHRIQPDGQLAERWTVDYSPGSLV